MKIIRYDLPAVTATTTTLSTENSVNDTVLTVGDTSSFSANDFILIEKTGNEISEIAKISTVDSSTQITLVSGLDFVHDSGATITKLNYDKYKITVDSGSGASALVTAELDYSNEKNEIEYIDETGADSYSYEIFYVNSHTATEDSQTTLTDEDNFSYMSAADFRAESGITTTDLSDALLYDALNAGVEYIKDKLYVTHEFEESTSDTQFQLQLNNLFVADYRADRTISKKDIVVYEYDYERKLKRYVNDKITKIVQSNNSELLILTSESLPSSDKTLVFEIPLTFKEFSTMRSTLKSVNKLLAINYVLQNTSNQQAKEAVLNWTAGGTSVSRDPAAGQAVIDTNNRQADSLISTILSKTYLLRTKLRSQSSSLNVRRRGSTRGRIPFSRYN